MKKLKKLSAILLAMIMTMLVALPAMAAPGKVNVTLPQGETVYEAYRVFDIEYNNPDDTNSAKVYTIDKTLNPFYEVLFGTSAAGNNWFDAKEAPEKGANICVVTAKNQITDENARAIAEFLKNAIEEKPDKYASAKIALKSGGTTQLDDNGYYLIYSPTAGTAGLALKSANETIDITSKISNNPSITKKITAVNGNPKEGQKVTASIGDTVSFEVVVTIPQNIAQDKGDVVVTDTSVLGLDIDKNTIHCKKAVDNDANGKITANDARDFTFKLTQTELATGYGTYTITYDAVLTGNGVDKYDNTASMEFDKVTVKAIASVITNLKPSPNPGDKDDENHGAAGPWTLLKVDEANKLLKGAQFEIYRDEACNKKINFEWKDNTYTATAKALKTQDTTSVIDLTCPSTNANGPVDKPSVEIIGLAGKVYVKEIKAPAGYNALEGPVTIDLDTNFPGKWDDKDVVGTWTKEEKGYPIVNKTGSLLPSTGGIGTTIFYIAGAILLIGAVVLLVVRRRMNK